MPPACHGGVVDRDAISGLAGSGRKTPQKNPRLCGYKSLVCATKPKSKRYFIRSRKKIPKGLQDKSCTVVTGEQGHVVRGVTGLTIWY